MPALSAAAASDATTSQQIRTQINTINQDVAKKKAEMEALNAKIEQYRQIVMQKKAEGAELEDQVALLDNNIAKNKLSVDIIKGEISVLDMEVKSIDEQIDGEMKHMDRERTLIASLMRKLYRAGYRKSTLEILLSYGSFSEFFDGLQSIVELQSGVDKALNRLKESAAALADDRANRERKLEEAGQRKRDLEVAKAELEDQRELKQSILIETKSSELEYRYMLADMKREQAEADQDIDYLEKALREKLDIADRLARQETILSWPVDPSRGLSTYFHDPEYPSATSSSIRPSTSAAVRGRRFGPPPPASSRVPRTPATATAT
jgi:chromosome segregation ATPase